MSLTPYVFDHILPYNDDLFGLELHPNLWVAPSRDLWVTPAPRPLWRSYSSPLGQLKSQLERFDDWQKNMHIGKDGFEVKLDVKHFKPEEIKVKAVDNTVVIEAKHEERKDDFGSISRHIVRRYDLPDGFKPEHVVSSLSSDGLLIVKCPKPETLEGSKVREIQIQPTGPARLTHEKGEEAAKEKTEEKKDEKK